METLLASPMVGGTVSLLLRLRLFHVGARLRPLRTSAVTGAVVDARCVLTQLGHRDCSGEGRVLQAQTISLVALEGLTPEQMVSAELALPLGRTARTIKLKAQSPPHSRASFLYVKHANVIYFFNTNQRLALVGQHAQ